MLKIQRHIQSVALAVLLGLAVNSGAQTKSSVTAEPISSALDAQLFELILLGEINAQGGEPGTAYPLLLQAARKSNDSRLYLRAIEVAMQSRQGESALQAAKAWRQANPNSREANTILLQILVGMNRISESLEPLKRELAATSVKNRPDLIAKIPPTYSRVADKKLAASIVEQALAEHLTPPEVGSAAWTTIGRMRLAHDDTAGALDAATQAMALAPQSQRSASLALTLIGAKNPQAEALVKKYLEKNSDHELRMNYARVLLDAQRNADAAEQLNRITTEKPDFEPGWLILGSLELQNNKPAQAEIYLNKYIQLATNKKSHASPESQAGLTQSYFLMSQIAEQRKDYVQAEKWLSRIDYPQEMLRIQMRRANLLASQGKLDEGRKLLDALPGRTPEELRTRLAAHVQLLRDHRQNQAAYDLLAAATTRDPKDLEFVYDQAMLAEKLGRIDEMERLLRAIIAAKPDHYQAYNALGYSMADRNQRLPEAKKLIQKALEFLPNDPFISDSLGWVEFRLGNKAEALRILQSAYKQKPDAEIAAHLGEVLWSLDQRDQAMSIWKEGLQLNAANETLLETIKRLRVKL